MTHDIVINSFSYIWRQSAGQCIEHLASLGYRRFELLVTAPHLWPTDTDAHARAALRRLTERLAVKVTSLNAGGFDHNLSSPAADVREFALRYLCSVIDLAADLHAPYVVMVPGIGRPLLLPPHEWLIGWFHAGMHRLVRHAQSRDVQLLVENVPFAFLPRAEALLSVLADYPPESVGVVYDTANAVYAGEDPVAGVAMLAPRLRLVHLCDTPLEVWRHDAIGRGVVPFAAFHAALRRVAPTIPTVFEIASRDPDRDIGDSVAAWDRFGALEHE